MGWVGDYVAFVVALTKDQAADAAELIADLLLEGRETGREQLGAPSTVLITLRQWGEKWISGVPSNPVLVDRQDRRPVAPMAVGVTLPSIRKKLMPSAPSWPAPPPSPR